MLPLLLVIIILIDVYLQIYSQELIIVRKVIIDSLKATAITVGGYTFDDKKHKKEADTELVKWFRVNLLPK